jgi:hypothetical protein
MNGAKVTCLPRHCIRAYRRAADESAFQKYPIHIAPEGRSALSEILTSVQFSGLRGRSDHGVTHGGIVLHTPQFGPLFRIRRYEGETPQFVHRWVLKEALEEGVDVRRGKAVVRVKELEGGKVEVIFQDGAKELADLVIGELSSSKQDRFGVEANCPDRR